MKIALYNLTTTTKAGGIETFNWGMAKALARRGHTVHIYGGRGEIRQDIPETVSIYKYPYIERNKIPDFGTRFRKFMERLSFGMFAFKDLIKKDYDYIYVSKPFDIPVALLSSSFSKARIIFSSGGTEFFPGYRQLVKKVDYFFACSEFNANQIEQYCKVRPLILPNGVNTELFKPINPDSELKHKLNLDGTESVIISACRLVGWKGIRYAIKAVAKLIEKGYVLKYLIIGDGEDKKNLQLLARNLKIEDKVIFSGNIENSELPKYYSIANIAVFPSIADETFGISIAEAMASGVPVISTRVGGIPEVVAEGTGLLAPPRDEGALSELMENLISDREQGEKFSISGRKWVIENFSWDRIVEKFERYINN